MVWYTRIFLLLVVRSIPVPVSSAQNPPAKPKAKVELRWLETKRVEGLTEDKGFQSSCDPDDIVYPHKKSALVLTAAEVAEVRLTKHDFRKSGLGINYTVTLHLTKDARTKLAATVEGKEMRLLTVAVDGKYWGAGDTKRTRTRRSSPSKRAPIRLSRTSASSRRKPRPSGSLTPSSDR